MKEEITFTMGLRGGTFRECHPRYSELSVEYERDSGEMAFGQSLSGKLKFIDTDYDWIMAQDRGVEILVNVVRGSITFNGKFTVTSCEIDTDNRLIEVELEANDAYSWIKAHKDDTFDLVKLAPEAKIIEYVRRACWQYYRQGDKKLTAISGGDYFELDATQVSSHKDLVDTYHFALIDAECSIHVTVSASIPSYMRVLAGKVFKGLASDYLYSAELTDWRLQISLGGDYGIYGVVLQRKADAGWTTIGMSGGRTETAQYVSYKPDNNSTIYYYYGSFSDAYLTGMYARLVHNNADFSPKYDLPTEDIVAKTLNYNYVSIPGAAIVNLRANNEYSEKPTEWGLAPDNVSYYKKPYVIDISAPLYPVGKTTWGEYSWWAFFDYSSSVFDYKWWDLVQLKDAYPLYSVLGVLLQAIVKDSGYVFEEVVSDFFDGNAGSVPAPPSVFITPKTNVLVANYSQKAQKGEITLGNVLDMLRDVFRCYWWVETDADGLFTFRIEHIYWFYNGGSYTAGTPYNIRGAKDPRTGKLWTYGCGKFKFDISELYKRYEFGWQDESTDWFTGDNVTCLARYVNESATNKAEVKAFTTDLDYMLIAPDEFSKDGFALLGASPRFLLLSASDVRVTLVQQTLTAKYPLAPEVVTFGGRVKLYRGSWGLNEIFYAYFYDASGNKVAEILSSASDKDAYADLPAGTAYVAYYTALAGFTITVYPITYYPRVNMPDASNDVVAQNYRLAFHNIERSWYLYDYPCRNIAFGDGDDREAYEVEGWYPVKKAMEQEVSLPWTETFDPQRGVLSTTGTAVVTKYEINLLSLFQKLTLMYGTDTK